MRSEPAPMINACPATAAPPSPLEDRDQRSNSANDVVLLPQRLPYIDFVNVSLSLSRSDKFIQIDFS
jgi:hypothetical protein